MAIQIPLEDGTYLNPQDHEHVAALEQAASEIDAQRNAMILRRVQEILASHQRPILNGSAVSLHK